MLNQQWKFKWADNTNFSPVLLFAYLSWFKNPDSLHHFPITSFFPLDWFASQRAFLILLLCCPLGTIHIPMLTQVHLFVFHSCMFVVRLVCYMVCSDILCGRLCIEQTYRLCMLWMNTKWKYAFTGCTHCFKIENNFFLLK